MVVIGREIIQLRCTAFFALFGCLSDAEKVGCCGFGMEYADDVFKIRRFYNTLFDDFFCLKFLVIPFGKLGI